MLLVSDNRQGPEEIRRKNVKLAVILALIAVGIYAGFIILHII